MEALAPLDRFWNKVDIAGDDDCWLWTAGTDKDGYGKFRWDRRTILAHRMAWILSRGNGVVPEDMKVCHTCDNPPCCNPGHLWLGTHADNHADRDAKNRGPRRTRNASAKLTEEQVAEIKRRLNSGDRQVDIARAIGCTRQTIWRIDHGILWR